MIAIRLFVCLIAVVGIVGNTVAQYGTGGMRSTLENESLNSRAPVARLISTMDGYGNIAIRQDGSILTFGETVGAITNFPFGLIGVVDGASNGYYSLLIKNDQSVVALYDPNRYLNAVPTGLKATQVAVGYDFAVALKTDGKLAAWGFDNHEVTKGIDKIANVAQIVAGPYNLAIIKTDGTVSVVGVNDTKLNDVPQGLKNVVQVSLSMEHAIALKSDGTVVVWGRNGLFVPSDLTGVVQVVASSNGVYSLALKSDGKVVAWNNTKLVKVPVEVSRIKQLATGANATAVGLRTDGSIIQWFGSDNSQVYEPMNLKGVIQFATDGNHRLFLTAEGKVIGSDLNANPGSIIPIDLKDVVQVAAGFEHSLALKKDGSVVGWGQNSNGQIDVQLLKNVKEVFASVQSSYAFLNDGSYVALGGTYVKSNPSKDVVQFVPDSGMALARKRDGTVVALGDEPYGRINVPAGLKNVKKVALSTDFALALRDDGSVVMWGRAKDVTLPQFRVKVQDISAQINASLAIATLADGSRVIFGATKDSHVVEDFDGVVQFIRNRSVSHYLYAVSVCTDQYAIFQNGTATATITLPIAPKVDTDIPITCSSLLVQVPALVRVPAGSHTAKFTISSPGTFDGVATFTAKYLGATAMTSLIVKAPNSVILTVNPATVKGGASATVTAKLASGVAPAGGQVVTLTSDQVSAVVPATVTIPAGQSSTNFTVTTSAVSALTTAKLTSQIALAVRRVFLTIQPASLSSVTCNPSRLKAGSISTGTVTLDGIAPSGGLTVSLSSNSKAATVPESVSVPAGATSASFTISTSSVATSTALIISAKAATVTTTATLTVDPSLPILSSQSLDASAVTGDSTAMGTVNLDIPAGAGGVKVTLSSDNKAAEVPAFVTVPEGKTSATFLIETNPVATDTRVTITSKLGTVTKSSVLTVLVPKLQYLTLDVTRIIGGTAAAGLVGLNAPAGPGGVTINLTSSDPSVTVPVSVSIQEGGTYAFFKADTKVVTVKTRAVISAKLGASTQSIVLTVNPQLVR